MNIEFTTEDINKLNELIGNTPFKYAYPFFQYFQGKVNETLKAEELKKQPPEDGN